MRIANVALDGSKNYGSRLCDWLRDTPQDRLPNIVTLQKIGKSEHFPTEALGDLGYESWPLWKKDASDLGVAVLSRRRRGLSQPKVLCCELPGAEQRESRFLTVEVDGLWVSSIYAPYGGKSRQAIEQRVAWLSRLRKHLHEKGYADRPSLLSGDFNVILDEKLGTTGDYTCYEQKELGALLNPNGGFVDLYRQEHCDPSANPGRTRGYDAKHAEGTSRLHLILASRSLARCLRDARLDCQVKKPRPDAPPLVVELEDIGA